MSDKPIEQWIAADYFAEAARVLGVDLKSEEATAGAIMLAALYWGTGYWVLRRRLGIPRKTLTAIRNRLIENRIFQGDEIHADWFEEPDGLAFALDVNVALGRLTRVDDTGSRNRGKG